MCLSVSCLRLSACVCICLIQSICLSLSVSVAFGVLLVVCCCDLFVVLEVACFVSVFVYKGCGVSVEGVCVCARVCGRVVFASVIVGVSSVVLVFMVCVCLLLCATPQHHALQHHNAQCLCSHPVCEFELYQPVLLSALFLHASTDCSHSFQCCHIGFGSSR